MADPESFRAGDPMTPAPASVPCLNAELQLWEFSRYEDVGAALREPALWPVAPLKPKPFRIPDPVAQQALRAQLLDRFSPSRLSAWQARLQAIPVEIPVRRPIDLVADFIEPWCLAAAGILAGAPPEDCNSLATEARIVSQAAAEPLDENLRLRATQADGALARYFAKSPVPMASPTFVAISRTVACLLANGWAMLLEHAAELEELRRAPGLLPKAVEEILRLASIPQTVFRHASAVVTIAGIVVDSNDRVILRLAAANRDPLVFSNPDRFEIARRSPGHLSLGFGSHACAGRALIRMTVAAATAVFLERFGGLALREPPVWEGGVGFRSPRRLLAG
jgi:cytochrome P450